MKTILLLFINSIFGLAGIGQDSTISLSKFETFSSQPLKILKIETKEIGSVGPWRVTKLKTTDAATGINFSAVRVDRNVFNNIPEIINPTTLYLNIEDLDSVIYALDYFIKEQNIQKPEGYMEYAYFTSADVKVSCYYDGNWRFELSKVYQKLRSPAAGSVITFNKKRIIELVELLRQSEIAKL